MLSFILKFFCFYIFLEITCLFYFALFMKVLSRIKAVTMAVGKHLPSVFINGVNNEIIQKWKNEISCSCEEKSLKGKMSQGSEEWQLSQFPRKAYQHWLDSLKEQHCSSCLRLQTARPWHRRSQKKTQCIPWSFLHPWNSRVKKKINVQLLPQSLERVLRMGRGEQLPPLWPVPSKRGRLL